MVTLAALINAAKLTGKDLEDLKVLIVGLGAAGIATAKIFLRAGVTDIVGCDSRGAVHTDRADYQDGSMPPIKRWFAEATNPEKRQGGPADVIEGADLFIGLSGARVMEPEALRTHEPRRDGVRDGQPEPGDHAGGGRAVRARDRDRPQRLPEPDQQRPLLPRHLPRRARRPRARHHRGDEDGGRARDRVDRRRRRAARGLHRPERVQPRRAPTRWPPRSPTEAKAQGTAEARGDEVGYTPGETEEFRAVRP